MAHTPRSLYWVAGVGSKAYTDPANWSITQGGTGGNGVATPDAGDTGIPEAGDTVYIIDGNSQIAGSDQSAIALAGFYVSFSPKETASVPQLSLGSSGSPLKVALADAGLGKVTGTPGDIYLGITFAGVYTARMEFLGTGNVYLSGTSASGSGTILVGERSGKVTIGSDYGGAFAVRNLGGTVAINASVLSGSPLVTNDDGQTVSDRNLSTCQVAGGVLTLRGKSTMSLVTVLPSGVYNHQSTGTATTISLSKGAVATDADASGPFIVTNSTAAKGSKLFEQPHVAITYSNATLKLGYA